ncbi:magnesium transporter CorA family protein [Spongisporangium articulatum]|uniref:Magnesium transporter CorA family protein n=1 Tax=Spongisporangium articulatum TaxID=3362603 RepID=A0ABW8APH9_9ACTN
MEIRVIDGESARSAPESDLAGWLAAAGDVEGDPGRAAGLLWVDVPCDDPEGERVLREVFEFDPRAVRDCLRRNPTPKFHIYDGRHVFMVLHVPYPGAQGHVHSIELDLFIGPGYLVTVHGPLNPKVDPGVAQIEVDAVARRLSDGRWLPSSIDQLVHAVVTGLNRQMNAQLAQLRYETWELERQVTSGALGDPEAFLEEMFSVRLGLQAIRTMAALNHTVYARMSRLRVLGDEARFTVKDSLDQFERVMASADIQTEYLQGVIEFYQTRINTKMTVAAERLAVIAAVTLPVTALSSIMGMNVIVNDSTHWGELIVLLAVMLTMSAVLLVWARRQGWW